MYEQIDKNDIDQIVILVTDRMAKSSTQKSRERRERLKNDPEWAKYLKNDRQRK